MFVSRKFRLLGRKRQKLRSARRYGFLLRIDPSTDLHCASTDGDLRVVQKVRGSALAEQSSSIHETSRKSSVSSWIC